MIVFRHADARYPFLWEDAAQPAARWHEAGEGPVQYFADTPDGAWAEFLRHEEIHDEADLATIRRALWAVEIPDEPLSSPRLPRAVLTGGTGTYDRCRKEARRLREAGATAMVAPSAALRPGEARGWRVEGGARPGPAREGRVIVLFGRRPAAIGWAATVAGRPGADLLRRVRHFRERG